MKFTQLGGFYKTERKIQKFSGKMGFARTIHPN